MQSRDWLAYIFRAFSFCRSFPLSSTQAHRVPRKSGTFAEIGLGVTYDLCFNFDESSCPASRQYEQVVRLAFNAEVRRNDIYNKLQYDKNYMVWIAIAYKKIPTFQSVSLN